MEKYAVIKLASRQYLVHEGDVIELERQEKPLKIEVLMYSDGSKNTIGKPEVKGILVKAVVLEEKLGKKTRVARFKKKSRYERVKGHRQPVSVIKIEKIGLGTEKEEVVEKKVEKKLEARVEEKKVIVKKAVSKKKTTSAKKASTAKPVKNLKGSK